MKKMLIIKLKKMMIDEKEKPKIKNAWNKDCRYLSVYSGYSHICIYDVLNIVFFKVVHSFLTEYLLSDFLKNSNKSISSTPSIVFPVIVILVTRPS